MIHFAAQLLQFFLLRLAEPTIIMFVHEPGQADLLLLGESLQRHDHSILIRRQLFEELLGQLSLELGRKLLGSCQRDFQCLMTRNHIY